MQFELAPPEFDTQGLVEVAISVLPPLLLLGGLFFLVRHPSPTQPTSPPNHTSPPITPLLPSHLSSQAASPSPPHSGGTPAPALAHRPTQPPPPNLAPDPGPTRNQVQRGGLPGMGPGNQQMQFGKSRSEINLEPDTG